VNSNLVDYESFDSQCQLSMCFPVMLADFFMMLWVEKDRRKEILDVVCPYWNFYL